MNESEKDFMEKWDLSPGEIIYISPKVKRIWRKHLSGWRSYEEANKWLQPGQRCLVMLAGAFERVYITTATYIVDGTFVVDSDIRNMYIMRFIPI